MTDAELKKLKRLYHRPEGIVVVYEIRVINDLIAEIERLKLCMTPT